MHNEEKIRKNNRGKEKCENRDQKTNEVMIVDESQKKDEVVLNSAEKKEQVKPVKKDGYKDGKKKNKRTEQSQGAKEKMMRLKCHQLVIRM
jgi:hypothetical protein